MSSASPARRLRTAALSCALAACAGVACAGSSHLQREPPAPPAEQAPDFGGHYISGLLGVSDEVARWEEVSAEHGRGSPEALALRHPLMDRLITASFAADRVVAELQSEEARVQDAMNGLEDQNGDKLGKLNLLAGILGGAATLGTALTLKNSTNEGGIWVTVIAGGTAAVLTSIAATSTPAGPAGVPIGYSMLGPILQDRADPRYLPIVWRYLHAEPPGASASPRDHLLQEWKRLGWLDPEELSPLTRQVQTTTHVTLEMLSQRLRMLEDVRSEVSRMKTGISNLADRLVLPDTEAGAPPREHSEGGG